MNEVAVSRNSQYWISFQISGSLFRQDPLVNHPGEVAGRKLRVKVLGNQKPNAAVDK
jgi:hypothetical protein